MQLTIHTTILDLVQDYPFLIDDLANRNSAFIKLKNPLLRQTMGRFASLAKVAAIGKENVLELILFIAGRIMNKTGDQVEIIPPEIRNDPPQPAMSKQERRENLKQIIRQLHDGAELSTLRQRFEDTVGDITPQEIGNLEQELVREGLPETEIKRLCDLHVQIFAGCLGNQTPQETAAGHPVHTFITENEAAAELITALRQELDRMGPEPQENIWAFTVNQLRSLTSELAAGLHMHYLRKENQLFPLLEEHNLEAPAKVMWEVHDEIRAKAKSCQQQLPQPDRQATWSLLQEFIRMAEDMIYKEENILFPMVLDTLSEQDWARVRHGEEEIGYGFGIVPGAEWQPARLTAGEDVNSAAELVNLDTGNLAPEIVNAILCNLPVDISFVDADDNVAYYSDSTHRIFPRSAAVIGRNVKNCHPPKSLHMVTEILEKLKNGDEDQAEFWLEMAGKFIHIRYQALRDRNGKYLGCLEVGQDATHLRSLSGQRRLLQWEY